MTGLYIHIPFCKSKCMYCDFASYTGREGEIGRYVVALEKEIRERVKGLGIGSVFVGGGTPTLVDVGLMAEVLGCVLETGRIEAGCEISIEANPGTVEVSQLERLRRAGFNRLSIGVQAVQDRLLASIGRIHCRADAEQAVVAAKRAGFENINVDLMYALPGQAPRDWAETLDWAVAQRIGHISAYSLIVEDGTPLKRAVDAGDMVLPTEDDELEMLSMLEHRLSSAGYQRYEISNYAQPGYRCRHNLLYWANGEYIGVGVAAHSRVGMRRMANPASIDEYVGAVERGELPLTVTEEISPDDDAFESIMLALRTTDGLNVAKFIARHGFDPRVRLAAQLATLDARGWLERDSASIRLTYTGLLMQNSALIELMSAFDGLN